MPNSMRTMLEAELKRKLQEVDALKLLLATPEEPANQTSAVPSNGSKSEVTIEPQSFAGMEKLKAAAVEKCLRLIGRSATIDELVQMLEAGGLRLYDKDPSRAPRNLRITVRMNSKTRHPLVYDSNTDKVWLREWDRQSSTTRRA